MSDAIYLNMVGKRQGHISAGASTIDSIGNVYQDGHEDHIFIYALSHNLSVPTDPQSGQPTQPRMHGPLSFTKPIDRTTPLLAAALCSGERMEKCEFIFYRTSASGVQEAYFKIILEDAVPANSSLVSPDSQTAGNLVAKESISLTYRKITWEHLISGTSGVDDWRKPVA